MATDTRERAAVFEEHRPMLFGISYRMLGSVTDAEEVVQDTWLRWDGVDPSTVRQPRPYLVQAVTRMAIDRMRRVRTRREVYVGPWLPEPLLTSPDAAEPVELADSVSMAMLVVLETLSPLERAVFVLREAFAFSYPEIAEAVDRAEATVRQLVRRARGHVEERRVRYETDRAVLREVTTRFLDVCLGGDLPGLMDVLAPEVTMWADSNGTAETPRVPLHGSSEVAAFFVSVVGFYPPGLEVRLAEVNGGPAAIMTSDGAVFAVIVLGVQPGSHRVGAIRAVLNKEKFTGVRHHAAA